MNDDFFKESRWANYARATRDFPDARSAEIGYTLELLDARQGQTVLDFGCGPGTISFAIAGSVGESGKVHALDTSMGMVERLNERLNGEPIEARQIQEPILPIPDECVDAISSLANFHHVTDKQSQFREFSRVLKPGGRIVIGDVAQDTDVQRYFDGTVDAVSSTGHKHAFLDRAQTERICEEIGIVVEYWEIRSVPWVFPNAQTCAAFLHMIHDATCTQEECLSHAKRDLGYQEIADRFTLNWQLFFFVGCKPSHHVPCSGPRFN